MSKGPVTQEQLAGVRLAWLLFGIELGSGSAWLFDWLSGRPGLTPAAIICVSTFAFNVILRTGLAWAFGLFKKNPDDDS